MRRVGILGGTFNPVHIGHLRLALEMWQALELDQVELVPAAWPPHKPERGMLDFGARLELLHLAVDGLPMLAVNGLEADRPGPSYTIDTLVELARQRPDTEFFFLMGAGDLLNLHLWKRGFELERLAHLAVATRDHLGEAEVSAYIAAHPEMGFTPDGSRRWGTPSGRRLALIDIPRLDISASFIRERFRHGANLRFLLPASVEEALARNRGSVLSAWFKECS